MADEKSKSEGIEETQEDATIRGRPGRRTTQERLQAVLELLAGKASVDQLATRYGVRPETVEGWRAEALGGIEEALRRGEGKSPQQRALEKENNQLRGALVTATMQVELLQQAMKLRSDPSRPAKSRR